MFILFCLLFAVLGKTLNTISYLQSIIRACTRGSAIFAKTSDSWTAKLFAFVHAPRLWHMTCILRRHLLSTEISASLTKTSKGTPGQNPIDKKIRKKRQSQPALRPSFIYGLSNVSFLSLIIL